VFVCVRSYVNVKGFNLITSRVRVRRFFADVYYGISSYYYIVNCIGMDWSRKLESSPVGCPSSYCIFAQYLNHDLTTMPPSQGLLVVLSWWCSGWHRTRDRKVAGSTPGWGAIKSTRSTQPSIPPG